MEPFIRNDQYNFIQAQIQVLINGRSTVNDPVVLNALKSLVLEKVINLFDYLSIEQKQQLQPIVELREPAEAEQFLTQLKSCVIPFQNMTEKTIQKLFPKVKKLKMPPLDRMDRKARSFLGWNDISSQRKYIIAEVNHKLIGFHGTFTPVNKKGFCTICHKLEQIGMFMTETKGTIQGTFTKRGNYICQDSERCNRNLTSLENLHQFLVNVHADEKR